MQRISPKITALCAVFLLAACNQVGGAQPIDAQKFLSSLDGPKITSVQDSLLDSAKDSEKSGNFGQAAVFYQQALVKHPDNQEIMLALADSYRRSGNFERAMPIYDELLKKDPKLVAAREGKGLALMSKGDYDAPAALFQEVLKDDPKRWKTLNALGILFTTRNMQGDAQKYFDEALKQSPSNPSILNNIGLSQALDKKFEDAIASLTKASALTTAGTDDRKRIDLNLALVYATAGKLDDARAIAETYYKGPVLDNNMGLYAHLAKDDQLAKAYLNMALTNSKTFYEKAWNNLQNIDTNNSPAPAAPSAVPVSTSAGSLAPAPAAPAVAPPAPAPTPAAKKPEKPTSSKKTPVLAPSSGVLTLPKPKTPVVKKEDEISKIVNSTEESEAKPDEEKKSEEAKPEEEKKPEEKPDEKK